ncbi:MAG: hypothetical protein E7328_00280 [Clostridiales bacterium]|nr:hypothetical protein [Clostridiales bacterium]
MSDRLGHASYGKFILLAAISKVLLMDRSYMALGGGGFLLPLFAAALMAGLMVMLHRGGRRAFVLKNGQRPDGAMRIAMGLVALGIFFEVVSLVGSTAVNMKYETFLTTDEGQLAAAVLGAMALAAIQGLTGLEGAGKIGLVVTLLILLLVLSAGYSNYDGFRIFPLLSGDGRQYVLPLMEWLMAFWPVVLLWVFPKKEVHAPEMIKSGLKGILWGGLWCAVVYLGCVLVRSPFSAQPGYSPVEFLFEQATMGRAFYRLDPLISIAITMVTVVTGALALSVCGVLLQQIIGLPHKRPVVALTAALALLVLYWVLTPGSPLWGSLAMIRSLAPGLMLSGLLLRTVWGRSGCHEG